MKLDEPQALDAFAALSQQTRLQMVKALVVAGPDGLPAGLIGEKVGASSSSASFHLSNLERAGLVQSRREARSIIYSASYVGLAALVEFLMMDCCQGHPEVCAPNQKRPVHAADLTRRLGAEALGTGLLVATVVGSGIMAERLTDDIALALLGNTLPTGAILFVVITLFGPISGAHLNPAVTFVVALQRGLPWSAAGLYVGAQIIGGIAGTAIAHVMFEAPVFALGDQVRTGAAQWLSEGVATFGLLLIILVGARHKPAAIPALVACYIVAAYWFTASTSFANPAVAIARAFTASFSGIRPIDAPAFIASQLAGAILAMAISRWLLSKESAA